MFNEFDEILTLEQLMDILCIGRNTAYKLLKSGQIKGFLLGNRWKIPRITLEEYIVNMCSLSEK